jgi:hypothetical protein
MLLKKLSSFKFFIILLIDNFSYSKTLLPSTISYYKSYSSQLPGNNLFNYDLLFLILC